LIDIPKKENLPPARYDTPLNVNKDILMKMHKEKASSRFLLKQESINSRKEDSPLLLH
jgi:rubrerythrin